MTDELPPDPGMAVKMATTSLPDLDRVLAGGQPDPADVEALCDFVDERLDCADFRLVTLLKLRLAAPHLDPGLATRIDRSILGFKYWMDEPGDDGMCFWSENHQVLFAVCEYLAGQLHPDARFTNNGSSGEHRKARGRRRLLRWLGYRFHYGFTEWCSPTYYEEDAAALALFVDHADDPALVERARIVLDLLALDMAIHRFDGHFVGTSGRCYEEQKKDPARADVNDVLATFFGPRTPDWRPDLGRISSVVALSGYRVPAAIRAVAQARAFTTCRASQGLDLAEVARELGDPMDVETTGAFLWGMEAFTNPESIDVTLKAFRAWRMQANRFLAPLAPFARLAAVPGLAWAPKTLVRALNPATQGVAIQRANIVAERSPWWHLSSVAHHHAGEFGDQQHLWQASLPRGINVFTTHPGSPMFDNNARNFSPSYWVGNGRNPEIAQGPGALVALYDTRGRKGYLERERQRFTHLHFPFVRFDETELGADWVAGRVGDSYVGVRGLAPLERVADDELVQRGPVTGWGVVVASAQDHGSLADFVAMLSGCALVHRRGRLLLQTPRGSVEARWRRGTWVDGRRVPTDFPRYATPWVRAPRKPDRIDVECDGHRLTLDWVAGTRTETIAP